NYTNRADYPILIATCPQSRYRTTMKGGPKLAGCVAENSPRFRLSTKRRLNREGAALQHIAFSLIELLVVVALILVLTTLYWGSGSGNRQKALQASCQNNLQKI